MDCQKKKVKIVVPVYTETLSGRNEKSLRQTVDVLSRYPITLLAPEGLDVTALQREFSIEEVTRVSREWLGQNGIKGYNHMMLSREFYEMFADYEYILICQTDDVDSQHLAVEGVHEC